MVFIEQALVALGITGFVGAVVEIFLLAGAVAWLARFWNWVKKSQ